MPHIAQHEAAELWELCRDHAVAATKLRMASSMCQDPQVRNTLQRHAQEFQQAAQRLYQLLQEPGQSAYAGTWQTGPGATWQTAPGQAVGQAGTYAPAYGAQHGGQAYAGGVQPTDVVIVGDCLRMCKTFAVQCVWGATEASHPARQVLYQLAGEHLRMADEHYRWLEQHGVYASPKADYAAIHEYTGKLQQLMAMGQATVHQTYAAVGAVAPGYGYPGAAQPGYGSHAGQAGGYAGHAWGGYGTQASGGYGAYAGAGHGGDAGHHGAGQGSGYGYAAGYSGESRGYAESGGASSRREGYAEEGYYGGYRASARADGGEESGRRRDAY